MGKINSESIKNTLKNVLFDWRWPLLFAIAVFMAFVLRYPYLTDGHIDEVHTIGRALQIINTGDLNPHFFYHPTGTMYLCIPANILALAFMSREVGGRPGVEGASPLDLIRTEVPNPMLNSLYEGTGSKWWDLFLYRVRLIIVMLIPLQIIILYYIGKRLDLLAPALAAAFFLAFSSANIRDSVYVSVNNTTGTFCLLTVALPAFYACRKPPEKLRFWFLRLAALSFIVGLAVACKYNAGTFLLIPMLFGVYTLPYLSTGKKFLPEKMLAGFAVILLGMLIGFTLLTPYWFGELSRFIHNVLHQIWYFKVGHKDWNTFEPGLEMAFVNLRCIADQYGWLGLILTAGSIGYLIWSGFFRYPKYKETQWVLVPPFAACAGFFLLMSNQAVFFSRNFSLMWSAFFLCCTASWWYAAGVLGEKRGLKNVHQFQNLSLLVVTVILILKANWIDLLIGPEREWWRRNDEVITSLAYWLHKIF